MDRTILVTGATGYIASRLIPRLLAAGHRVRCLARDPSDLQGRRWRTAVEIVRGDVTDLASLREALKDVHTAYYLVHHMTYGRGYTAREREGARAFASAAAAAGVDHIIYLGGLADPAGPLAPHMHSRIETGRVLREGDVPVTEFRAGVIAGSGSISFEMIRFLTELFPVVPGPRWMKNRSQPIAIENVIDYLVAALTHPPGRGEIFEIGGPDQTTYGDLLLRYARVRGLRRWLLLLPGLPVWFMAAGVGLVTPVPFPIAQALIEGLSADSIVGDSQARRVFPDVQLLDFDSATRDALAKTDPACIEPVWYDGRPGRKSIRHEGCFIDHDEMQVPAKPGQVREALERRVDRSRAFTRRNDTDGQIRVSVRERHAGKEWIEWRLEGQGGVTRLCQTAFFSPRGLPGFLYRYLLYPLHLLRFYGLLRQIGRDARAAGEDSHPLDPGSNG